MVIWRELRLNSMFSATVNFRFSGVLVNENARLENTRNKFTLNVENTSEKGGVCMFCEFRRSENCEAPVSEIRQNRI